jgi:hypothetical protein
MENSLLKKLQIKVGFKVKVINAPENFPTIIGETPSDIEFSFNNKSAFNGLLIFAITKLDLLSSLKTETIDSKTICWIFYPKAKTELASDLNLMQNWNDLKAFNLTPCGSAAIDKVWTALRIKPAADLKRSGLGNTEIKTNELGNYIDVVNKKITLPEDLKAELIKNLIAFECYQSLSYSNRKEYLLWILTAKQEKTRLERIQKTIEKLIVGKKNPTEK